MRYTISILLLSLLAVGCSSRKPIPQAPQAVQAWRIEPQSNLQPGGLRFSAVVTPDSEVMLSFRIPGYLVGLKQVRGEDGRMRDLDEGDRVMKGAVLASMRRTEYEDKVRQAASQVEATDATLLKAKLDFDRATHLFESESLTKPQYDAARAQYVATQAQLRAYQAQTSEAEVSLRDTTLVAPFSGEIVKKAVELGAFVGPGVPTFAIANTDTVKIVVGVPDTIVRSVKVGQAVDVVVDAFPSRTFRARVSRISSAADTTTRNFDVEIAIPNRDHSLRAGMIGSLQLTPQDGTSSAPATIQVPLSAIVQGNDGKYGVFLITKSSTGNVAYLRSVEIGAVTGNDITVVSGLAAGDQIITTGANLLKDGQRVEVVQ